jgi:serine/threonine protein kinase/nitrogen-specific signal transduction histidine kinase/GAF domain-containing protein
VLSARGADATLRVFDSSLRQTSAVIKAQRLAGGSENAAIQDAYQKFCTTLASIRHPNLAVPYTFGVFRTDTGDTYGYTTRQFIDGVSLANLATPVSNSGLLHVSTQICRALDSLHARGLRHFDLKLENVVVRRAPAGRIDRLSQCVLIDLTYREDLLDQSHALNDVTLQYIAPELLEGHGGDSRTDLYALGVVLYRLATGTFPFSGTSLPQILRSQRAREFEALASLNPGIDTQFQKVVSRLLDPHPNNRPSSAQEVLALLESGQVDELGVPQPTCDDSWGFVGRHDELAACLTALDLESSKGAGSIEVRGAAGSGVTAFLREVQDRLESNGLSVLTARPRSSGVLSIQEQLFDPVNTLVRRTASGTLLKPRHARSTTDLLDDLLVAAQDRRVVLFVDDWHQCDASELSFLRRLVLQERAATGGATRRSGRCQLVLGATTTSMHTRTREASAGRGFLLEHQQALGGLERRDIQELVSFFNHDLRLSSVDVGRIQQATLGHAGQLVTVLGSLARELHGGATPSEALRRAISALQTRGADEKRVQEAKLILSQPHGDAAVILALWRQDLTLADWDAILRDCTGRSGSIDELDALVEEFERGDIVYVRSRDSQLGDCLAEVLSNDQRERVGECIARVFAREWRSHDPARLVPLLRFVGRLGGLPSRCRWPICRALVVLLRHGQLADIESFVTGVAADAAPWWLEQFRQAARVESGQADDDDERRISSSEGELAGPLFYATWIHARGLRRGRFRQEAYRLLKRLSETRRPDTESARTRVLEDFGIAAAEMGLVDEAVQVRKEILSRVHAHVHAHRRSRSSDSTIGSQRLSGAWKAASYYRVRHRIHYAQGRYRRALATVTRERLANAAAGTLVRKAACLNDEGVALIRCGFASKAVGVLERCAALREALDDERGVVVTLNNLSVALSEGGKFSAAAAVLNRARLIAARNGLDRHRNMTMLNLGLAYVRRGQIEDAGNVFRRVMRLARSAGDVDLCARAMFNCGSAALDRWYCAPAEGYAQRLDEFVEAHPGEEVAVEPDLLRAEMASRRREWDRVRALLECLRAKGVSQPSVVVLAEVLACNTDGERTALDAKARRRLPLFARSRIHLARWRARGARITYESLGRLFRLLRRRALLRDALEWLVCHLDSPQGHGDRSLRFGLKTLAALEFREGHDDLQVELRALLAGLLRRRDRPQEAWRLLEEALVGFRALERKLSRGVGSDDVLRHLHSVLRREVRGDVSRETSHRLTQSLCAEAFDTLMNARGRGRLGVQDHNAGALTRLGSLLGHGRDILDDLLEIALDNTGAQRAILVTGHGEERRIARIKVASEEQGDPGRDDISWAVVSQVLSTGEPCLYNDALTAEELASHRSIAVLQLRSLACVPVRVRGVAVGALYLDHHGIAGLFGEEHLSFLDLICGLLGTALHVTEVEWDAKRCRSELAETHSHIMRAERNRVSGELASGLAHDLKNVLAAIVARSQMLRLATTDQSTVRTAKAIEQAAQSGAGLIGRLQECSRDHSNQDDEPVDLVAAADEALELLRPRLTPAPGAEGAPIEASVSGDTDALVLGVPGELRELFLNLIVNSCDAMPTGGRLLIEISTDTEHREVALAVRDTGRGIPAAVLKRVFEPFFTTKGKSGTGLGLAVVRNTIVRCGGSVDVESTEGEGTTFTIRLPLFVPSERTQPAADADTTRATR